ncbi:cyclin-dependent kinase 4 inhibitor C [Hippoglossus hippoglossus]|uniref:cyclin-dependent kinase 4 inhibitor C n=1 Tax=Hippoglossus hippoglossus TaxID=8267 RepID=UPI00148C9619|nr:cyclin-dependent kinase 4 inhibitor C [Hippoglossus hippoglossus]
MTDRRLTDELCDACAAGNLSKVLSLLQSGAEVNGFNTFKRTALQVVKMSSTAVVEALIGGGASADVRDPDSGRTVTHDAAREGSVDTVRALMRAEANVNLVDDQGNLPLHLASKGGHLRVVQLLITRTAHPRATNGLGYTAAQLAHFHRRVDTAKYIDKYLSAN